MRIVTLEFNELDAFRLLFLVQREAAHGRIWDDYWDGLAAHIRENIKLDLEVYGQIQYQEELAGNKIGAAVQQPAEAWLPQSEVT
jgi:hypothetical protein